MTSPSSLLALEGKLVEAKEGSRELDKAINNSLNNGVCNQWEWDEFAKCHVQTPPPYSRSIDAALALVSRLGWHWSVVDDPPSARLWPSPSIDRDGRLERTAIVEAATPALAVCLALVRALKGAGE